MDIKLDIISIGEALIELSTNMKFSCADHLHKYYGGDCLATAISALRLGSKVGFITKVGNDPFKEYLLDCWQSEGLDISQVKLADEPNGLYMIARPSADEKEIIYYRKKIASSKLSINDISENYISNSKVVYSSGITQSLSATTSEAVEYAFVLAQRNNVMTAYDPNYYHSITTTESAKENFEYIIPNVDILFLNTRNDAAKILELDSVESIIKNLWDRGVSTVVLKSTDDKKYYTGYNGNIVSENYFTKNVIDTTCSGDAFNGGFLYGITNGMTPFEATKLASVVAGLQAGKIGAIKSIPYKDDVYSILKGKLHD